MKVVRRTIHIGSTLFMIPGVGGAVLMRFGENLLAISGRELREKLRAGQLPDPRILRPETARILIESMKGK